MIFKVAVQAVHELQRSRSGLVTKDMYPFWIWHTIKIHFHSCMMAEFDFSVPPKSNVFELWTRKTEEDKDIQRWIEFCSVQNVTSPTMADLGRFIDYYIDRESPSMKTVLSKVHGYAVEQSCFKGEEKGYKTLFSRVKKEHEKLGLDPTKASPYTAAELRAEKGKKRAILVGL